MPKTKEVINWLKKSQDDLITAQAIINANAPYWAACFHAQQAAEKVLKAAQIYFLKSFQKEHDLEILLTTLNKKFDTKTIKQECLKLSGFYVTARYPGIKESSLTLDDATSALKEARKIVEFIEEKISKT